MINGNQYYHRELICLSLLNILILWSLFKLSQYLPVIFHKFNFYLPHNFFHTSSTGKFYDLVHWIFSYSGWDTEDLGTENFNPWLSFFLLNYSHWYPWSHQFYLSRYLKASWPSHEPCRNSERVWYYQTTVNSVPWNEIEVPKSPKTNLSLSYTNFSEIQCFVPRLALQLAIEFHWSL